MKYDQLARNISLYASGTAGRRVSVFDAKKILRTMGQVISEKADENEPVKVKGLGTFGIYSYKVKENLPRGVRNGDALKGKSTFKEGELMKAGANHYKTIFKPAKAIKVAIN